jgi:maleate isomerase
VNNIHNGVLVPWANTVVEAELPRISGMSVGWHFARLVPASRTTRLDEKFLSGLVRAIPAALEQLSALPLSTVYLACTSAGFMYSEAVHTARQRSKIALVSAFEAITATLTRLSVTRIVLLTPYPTDVADAEAALFRQSGVVVTGSASLGLSDGYDTVAAEQLRTLIQGVGRAAIEEAEAVVLSCTGWPTLDLVPDMQRALGKPVISSNLAIGMHAQDAKETDATTADTRES